MVRGQRQTADMGISVLVVKMKKRRINPNMFSATIINKFVEHGFLERIVKNTRTYYYITKSGLEEVKRLGLDYINSKPRKTLKKKK